MERIAIPSRLMVELWACGRKALPQEACGIIHGLREKDTILVTGYSCIANVAKDPSHRFVLNPQELIPHLYAESAEKAIVGIFHTHPGTPPVPSLEDRDTPWSWPSYWIFSFGPEKRKEHLQIYDTSWVPLLPEQIEFQ